MNPRLNRFLLIVLCFLTLSQALAESWNFFVSAGAFRNKKNAIELRKKLLENWMGPEITIRKEKRLHVVFIGPFRTEKEAQQYEIKLDTMGYPAVILRR